MSERKSSTIHPNFHRLLSNYSNSFILQILIFEQHQVSVSILRLDQSPVLGETVIQKTIIPTDVKAMITVLKAAVWMGPWTWNVLRLFMK